MNRFKIGDKVTVVSGDYGITFPGSYGTVARVAGDYIIVDFDFINGNLNRPFGGNSWSVDMKDCKYTLGDWDE